MKKDPLSRTCKWRIPPSLPEVVTFDIDKIPLVIVVNDEGKEIERIVEVPARANDGLLWNRNWSVSLNLKDSCFLP